MRAPYLARSASRSVAIGALSFDVSFLGQGPKMEAPEIEYFVFRYNGQINIPGGKTVVAREIAQVFQRIFVTDALGDRVNISGATARQIEQREYGTGSIDPAGAAGANATFAVDLRLTLPFAPRRLQEPDDTRIPLSDILENGGQIRAQLQSLPSGNATLVTTTGSVEVYARIVDAGEKRATSRLRYRDYVVNGQDFRYAVEGLLVDAWLSNTEANIAANTTVPTQSFLSDSLGYQSYDDTVLRREYECALQSLATNDDVIAVLAQNFYCSRKFTSQAEMFNLNLVQVRLSAAPTAGSVLAIASITGKSKVMTANALGVSADALNKVAAHLDTKHGTKAAAGHTMAAFLPLKAKSA